jgi:5-methylthioribose kinase
VNAAAAQAHVARRLGLASTHAEALSGGLLNHVVRVFLTRGDSVIVKHAPPYVASRPELPLDPSRACFEAQALQWVGQRRDQRIGVPKLLDFEGSTLILQDLGACRDLSELLRAGEGGALLKTLGEWLRELHVDAQAPRLHNLPVQQTRLLVQYQSIGPLLKELGVPDAAELGARAEELGSRLLERGASFVMGDLWPPSVLVDRQGRPWIIDWELCTLGHPAQDLGHLAAHLWMHALVEGHIGSLAQGFLCAAGDRNPSEEWASRDISTHAACEVLLRSHGAFAGTGAFRGLDRQNPLAQRALAFALKLLRAEQGA